MMMKRLTRRDFLRASALSLGAVAISTGLGACSSGSDPGGSFQHGVASGDPLSDSILLWTRVTPELKEASVVDVTWEIATDPAFQDLVHRGTHPALAAHDFTVKVDTRNLLPGTEYYYRFRTANQTSRVGRTRTLPTGSLDSVRLAIVSCSNYPAGYFHVYRELAKRNDLDALLHLGDYIYEYDSNPDSYAAADAARLGRTFPANNNRELLTLQDYRRRYAIYHTDPDLQAAHAHLPFITVWDDHEVANDAWQGGAENHDPVTEGNFAERKRNALQAYFEWLPIRPLQPNNQSTIYRRFDFGDLVSLYMLDTRIIGRDEPLDYNNYFTASGFDQAGFTTDYTDPNRRMLGSDQLGWLQTEMSQSTATWQVLGQQVLMGHMTLPAELLAEFVSPDEESLAKVAELAELKARHLGDGPSLTAEEIARLETQLPYNLDAWDGYLVEREQLLGLAAQLDKDLVVLAGDTHNAWASNLKQQDGTSVGVEFATSSVSSPGMEEYLSIPAEQIKAAETAITLLVDDLQYTNLNQRGYLIVTFTAQTALAEWTFVDSVKQREYQPTARRHALQTRPGQRTLEEVT